MVFTGYDDSRQFFTFAERIFSYTDYGIPDGCGFQIPASGENFIA